MLSKKKFLRSFWYICFLIGVTFIALEIILRIWNPFHFRLKGDQIVLPVNTQVTIRNTINPVLDSVIVNTRNELGFRGAPRPAAFDQQLSIITVGGSTTECHFNSDDKTWPALLGNSLQTSFNHIWLNNAGIDGHSTFGHQVLLQDYLVKIKPRVIVFLTGINDIESDQPSFHDKLNKRGAWSGIRHYLVDNSEVLSLIVNLMRGWKAQKAHNTTGLYVDPRKLPVSDLTQQQSDSILAVQTPYLEGYRQRIGQITDTCIRYGIQPVFLTQPMLYGFGKDSVTGVDLAKIRHLRMSGKCAWEVLQLYNDVLRKSCADKKVLLIDLANSMPKDSRYFYDVSHFTNAGNEKVAEIVRQSLTPWLEQQFPSFKK